MAEDWATGVEVHSVEALAKHALHPSATTRVVVTSKLLAEFCVRLTAAGFVSGGDVELLLVAGRELEPLDALAKGWKT